MARETLGTLVKKVIEEGCNRLDITRGELATRLHMHRVSLYNLLNRPGGISLEKLVELMDELDVDVERQHYLVWKWCEDRAVSNPYGELLFPIIKDICKGAGVTAPDFGARVLRRFKRLR